MLSEAYEAAADTREPSHKRWVASFPGPASYYRMDRGPPPTAAAAVNDSGYSSGNGCGGGSATGNNSVSAGTPQPGDK